jgi:hypothetical protein
MPRTEHPVSEDADHPYPCSQCAEGKPRTLEFFPRDSWMRDGMSGRYFGSPGVEPHPEWFVGDIYGGPNDGGTLIWHRGGYAESDGTERMFVVAKIGGVPCITKDGRAWVGRWEVAECPRTW